MLRTLLSLLLGCVFSAAGANIDIVNNGVLRIDGQNYVQVLHHSDKWVPNRQGDRDFRPAVERQGDTVVYSGRWKLRGGDDWFDFVSRVSGSGNHVRVVTELNNPAGVPTGGCYLQFEIPVRDAAGKILRSQNGKLTFPADFKAEHVGTLSGVESLELPLVSGIARFHFPSPVEVQLRDGRKYKFETYTLRIPLQPGGKLFKHGKMEFELEFEPFRTETVDLARVVNMGFSDEVADDRKGGWTDQGPDNDLRMIQPGKIRHANVDLQILDPAKNDGKAALVLGGGGRPYFPARAVVELKGKTYRSLYLLHAVAWPPKGEQTIGTVKAIAEDGSETVREVKFQRDVENWWMPSAIPNGLVGWSAFGKYAPVGLYLSMFEFDGKPIREVVFESNGKSVWMIAAVSGSRQHFPLPASSAFTLWRNDQWRAFAFDRSVEPGSALDFSSLLDAPAGKYGFIQTTENGEFVFTDAPGKPVRFYGVNLCYTANFMEHAAAEMLAERLARNGFNALRIHHYDRDVVDRKLPVSTEMNPATLDQLDYLIAQLKKNGIYLTLDLFTARVFKDGEFKVTGKAPDGQNFKLLAMLDPEAQENLKRFARNLLTHVNPYTKLALANDPVLIGVSILNENTIHHVIHKASPEVRALYDREFEKFRLGRGDADRAALYREFLQNVYAKYYQEMSRFLREELGVRAPLTDQNYISAPEQTRARSTYDYVDNHLYFDHPVFLGKDWSLPIKSRNCSVLEMRLLNPKELAPTRVFGKPFTVTEFDYCYPNEYRAEGAPIFGAYAALQNWSAIYRFAYAHHWKYMLTDDIELNAFDIANDPVRLLGERLGIAFFVRGDVKSADASFAVPVSADPTVPVMSEYPEAIRDLSLYGKIGSVLEGGGGEAGKNVVKLDNTSPADRIGALERAGALPPGTLKAYAENKTVSLTGELAADFSAGTFLADTPRSAAAVLPQGRALAGKWFRAKAVDGFSVAGAVKLDDNRMLILHLTDVKAEKITYAAADRKVITVDGGKQLLARKGTAEISVAVDPAAAYELFALDCTGKRQQAVPFTVRDGMLTFTADTFGTADVTFAYELRKMDRK